MNILRLITIGLAATGGVSARTCRPRAGRAMQEALHPSSSPHSSLERSVLDDARHCPESLIRLAPDEGFGAACNFNFKSTDLKEDTFQKGRTGAAKPRSLESREKEFVRRQRQKANQLIPTIGDANYLDNLMAMAHYVSNSAAMGKEGTLAFRRVLEQYSIPFDFTVFRGKSVSANTLERAIKWLQEPPSEQRAEQLRKIAYEMIHTPFEPDIHITASASTRQSIAQKFLKNPVAGRYSVLFKISPNPKHPPLGLSKDAFPLGELNARFPELMQKVRERKYFPRGFSICQEAEIALNNLRNVYTLQRIEKLGRDVYRVQIEASGLPKGQRNPYAKPINTHEGKGV